MSGSMEVERPTLKADLWDRYRTAFDKWAVQVSRLAQVQKQTPETGDLVEAQHQTSAAEAAYRESRDWLMEKIAGPNPDSNDEMRSSASDAPGKKS